MVGTRPGTRFRIAASLALALSWAELTELSDHRCSVTSVCVQLWLDCLLIPGPYSLNKKEWICSLFKEWNFRRVKLEWIWSEHLFWVDSKMSEKHTCSLEIHWISIFSKIHSFKSEHIHSFLFRKYILFYFILGGGGGVNWYDIISYLWRAWLELDCGLSISWLLRLVVFF